MTHHVQCPHCQAGFTCRDEHFGKLVRCPHCQTRLTIGTPATESPSEPAAVSASPQPAERPATTAQAATADIDPDNRYLLTWFDSIAFGSGAIFGAGVMAMISSAMMIEDGWPRVRTAPDFWLYVLLALILASLAKVNSSLQTLIRILLENRR